jgi:hypothetical protein
MYFTNMAKRYGSECGNAKADQIGQFMMSNADLNHDGVLGWGLPANYDSKQSQCPVPGTWDAFSDNTCNPLYTEYMFQTGLVLDCLGQVYEITRNTQYIDFVKKVIDQTWNLGTSNIANCSDCFHYWYSYNKNDDDRFVRNTNIEMAVPLALLAKYSTDPADQTKYRTRLEQVLRFERSEYNLGNRGYFGSLDSKYMIDPNQKWNNENHMPSHVRYIARLKNILQNPNHDVLTSRLAYDWKYCPGNTYCANVRAGQDRGEYESIIQSGEVAKYTDTATIMTCSGSRSNSYSRATCDHELVDIPTQNVPVNMYYLLYVLEGM